MDAQFEEYGLSSQLGGHLSDVRGVCVCDDIGIATSSRDKTMRFWVVDPSSKYRYTLSKVMEEHTSFVGPIAWIPPSMELPEGGIVSGGMDALVIVWDLRDGRAVHKMRGHQLQVTGVAVDGQDVISTSMDCTIKRWRNGQLMESWQGHDSPIQAVLKLSSGDIVTGSSDMTAKLWNGKTCSCTFVGHADTVRGLALLDGLGVLSASHDGTIKLWSLSGDILMEMVGHTSIVYSVDAHVSGLIASASEDCSVKIWKNGVCIQSIEHPGCVWGVKFLGNGDLVSACSDGFARIWTKVNDRLCEPVEFEAYKTQLSEYKLDRKKIGGLKLADLPGLEGLHSPGSRDGETKVIREGDNGVAYSWSASERKWDKIGEVVDGPEETRQQLLDGSSYDYVFDVDIGDGEPIRRLPYNRGDNPYDVADKWLLKEHLALSYRQQIVEFILQNTGQKDTLLDTSFSDPYTGTHAYVPGGSSISSGFTTKTTFKHLPKKGMLLFDAAQFDGILRKIVEFNSSLSSDMEKRGSALSVLELERLNVLLSIMKDTSHYHSSTFADVDIQLLMKLLSSWPTSMLFPVIDIVRMIVLHPNGASLLSRYVEDTQDILHQIVREATSTSVAANLLTCIRAVVNLFKHSYFHKWLKNHRSEIIDAFSSCYSSANKNVQLAYSTLLLNYSVLLTESKDHEGQTQILSAALEVAEDNQDSDTKFRALIAIGTLMLEGCVTQEAVDFDVQGIAKAASASKDQKLQEVAADIQNLTSKS